MQYVFPSICWGDKYSHKLAEDGFKNPKNMPFARYCQTISIKGLSKYAPYTVQILEKLFF